jgi:hypothetical protein
VPSEGGSSMSPRKAMISMLTPLLGTCQCAIQGKLPLLCAPFISSEG